MSLALLFAAVAAPASAQIVQSVAFGAGFFQPRGFDRRVDGDTLVANLTQPDVLPGVSGSLDFDIGEFRGMPLFGEWNLGINKHIEFSAGLSYFTNKVDSVYADLINGPAGGTEIYTDEGRPAEFNAPCAGTTADNGLYGEGIINAAAAVAKK